MFPKMVSRRLRFIEGGEGGGGTPPTPPVPTPPAPPALPAPAPAPTPSASAAPPAAGQTFSSDYVTELRQEAAARRVEARAAAELAATNATERDAARTELTTIKNRGILTAAITAAGGNTIALAAIRGDDILAELDPAADDYATKVNAAVAKYVTDHPELKAALGTTRSSVPLHGGTGEGAGRPKSIQEALERATK
jgi:hypothetical protein